MTRILCLVFLAGYSACLQAANPELLAYEQGIEDPETASEELRLSDLALDFDVVGALVDVTLTTRFANPSSETLEGRFNFELPEGAVITGYALDIDGQLLDGVLVDHLKARRTFDAKVREGIDPGLAEVSRDNRFSTRVFPIPSEGERTIQLRFSAPIHSLRGLVIPLETEHAVGQFRISVTSTSLDGRPQITLPNELEVHWQDLRYTDRVTAAIFGQELDGELRIAPVRPRHTALLTTHANGEKRAHIVDDATRISKARETGKRLRVYWDRSLSRRDQDTGAERNLLLRHVESIKPSSIDLVVFNSSGASVRRMAADELDEALKRLDYRGATSFAVLGKLDVPSADQCLVFTDGVATIDARDAFEPGCEVYALTSAEDADGGFLQRLTGGNAAAVLRVGLQEDKEILARLRGSGPRVVRAYSSDGRQLEFTSLDGGEKGWSVITEVPFSGPIILQIAGIRNQLVEARYSPVATRRAAFAAAGALWAADAAARLAAEDGAHAAFVELSRRFSVASPLMSFLVLESASDYVKAGIELPANAPAGMREAHRETLAEAEEEKKSARENRLDEVARQWQEVVEWWNTTFDPQARKPVPEPKVTPRGSPATAAAPSTPQRPPGSETRREATTVIDSLSSQDVGAYDAGFDEVVVTGARASMSSSMNVSRSASVAADIDMELAKWDIQRPYLKALDAAAPADVDRVIAAQEREYGNLPAFYFDVAEWLRRHERASDAEEMLLSALELPVANEETSAMVAERLQRHGNQDRAIWLLQRAADSVDYLPQPKRSLALALARRAAMPRAANPRADMERAVALLDEVIMTPWESDYDGIELVALMEVNALLPKARALGLRKPPLDERLRALLDVDLRVVIEWNTLATDMDLWVDEPNGERAIYSNPRTAIGGRLSNDMTEGLGPEEYLLRRAAKGEYRISVHVYGTDAINPNGTTVVTARLYRDFGRAQQSEQTMEIELKPDDEGEVLVGKFVVR
jgi:hypothetical protein